MSRGRRGPERCGGYLCGAALGREPLRKVRDQSVDADAVLRHRVSISNRDSLVLKCVEVDGHAVGGPDLVLAAIAPTDRLSYVDLDIQSGLSNAATRCVPSTRSSFFESGRIAT